MQNSLLSNPALKKVQADPEKSSRNSITEEVQKVDGCIAEINLAKRPDGDTGASVGEYSICSGQGTATWDHRAWRRFNRAAGDFAKSDVVIVPY